MDAPFVAVGPLLVPQEASFASCGDADGGSSFASARAGAVGGRPPSATTAAREAVAGLRGFSMVMAGNSNDGTVVAGGGPPTASRNASFSAAARPLSQQTARGSGGTAWLWGGGATSSAATAPVSDAPPSAAVPLTSSSAVAAPSAAVPKLFSFSSLSARPSSAGAAATGGGNSANSTASYAALLQGISGVRPQSAAPPSSLTNASGGGVGGAAIFRPPAPLLSGSNSQRSAAPSAASTAAAATSVVLPIAAEAVGAPSVATPANSNPSSLINRHAPPTSTISGGTLAGSALRVEAQLSEALRRRLAAAAQPTTAAAADGSVVARVGRETDRGRPPSQPPSPRLQALLDEARSLARLEPLEERERRRLIAASRAALFGPREGEESAAAAPSVLPPSSVLRTLAEGGGATDPKHEAPVVATLLPSVAATAAAYGSASSALPTASTIPTPPPSLLGATISLYEAEEAFLRSGLVALQRLHWRALAFDELEMRELAAREALHQQFAYQEELIGEAQLAVLERRGRAAIARERSESLEKVRLFISAPPSERDILEAVCSGSLSERAAALIIDYHARMGHLDEGAFAVGDAANSTFWAMVLKEAKAREAAEAARRRREAEEAAEAEEKEVAATASRRKAARRGARGGHHGSDDDDDGDGGSGYDTDGRRKTKRKGKGGYGGFGPYLGHYRDMTEGLLIPRRPPPFKVAHTIDRTVNNVTPAFEFAVAERERDRQRRRLEEIAERLETLGGPLSPSNSRHHGHNTSGGYYISYRRRSSIGGDDSSGNVTPRPQEAAAGSGHEGEGDSPTAVNSSRYRRRPVSAVGHGGTSPSSLRSSSASWQRRPASSPTYRRGGGAGGGGGEGREEGEALPRTISPQPRAPHPPPSQQQPRGKDGGGKGDVEDDDGGIYDDDGADDGPDSFAHLDNTARPPPAAVKSAAGDDPSSSSTVLVWVPSRPSTALSSRQQPPRGRSGSFRQSPSASSNGNGNGNAAFTDVLDSFFMPSLPPNQRSGWRPPSAGPFAGGRSTPPPTPTPSPSGSGSGSGCATSAAAAAAVAAGIASRSSTPSPRQPSAPSAAVHVHGGSASSSSGNPLLAFGARRPDPDAGRFATYRDELEAHMRGGGSGPPSSSLQRAGSLASLRGRRGSAASSRRASVTSTAEGEGDAEGRAASLREEGGGGERDRRASPTLRGVGGGLRFAAAAGGSANRRPISPRGASPAPAPAPLSAASATGSQVINHPHLSIGAAQSNASLSVSSTAPITTHGRHVQNPYFTTHFRSGSSSKEDLSFSGPSSAAANPLSRQSQQQRRGRGDLGAADAAARREVDTRSNAYAPYGHHHHGAVARNGGGDHSGLGIGLYVSLGAEERRMMGGPRSGSSSSSLRAEARPMGPRPLSSPGARDHSAHRKPNRSGPSPRPFSAASLRSSGGTPPPAPTPMPPAQRNKARPASSPTAYGGGRGRGRGHRPSTGSSSNRNRNADADDDDDGVNSNVSPVGIDELHTIPTAARRKASPISPTSRLARLRRGGGDDPSSPLRSGDEADNAYVADDGNAVDADADAPPYVVPSALFAYFTEQKTAFDAMMRDRAEARRRVRTAAEERLGRERDVAREAFFSFKTSEETRRGRLLDCFAVTAAVANTVSTSATVEVARGADWQWHFLFFKALTTQRHEALGIAHEGGSGGGVSEGWLAALLAALATMPMMRVTYTAAPRNNPSSPSGSPSRSGGAIRGFSFGPPRAAPAPPSTAAPLLLMSSSSSSPPQSPSSPARRRSVSQQQHEEKEAEEEEKQQQLSPTRRDSSPFQQKISGSGGAGGVGVPSPPMRFTSLSPAEISRRKADAASQWQPSPFHSVLNASASSNTSASANGPRVRFVTALPPAEAEARRAAVAGSVAAAHAHFMRLEAAAEARRQQWGSNGEESYR